MRPVLLVAVLPQGGRDLGPVACTVQKDISYDLSLTAGKRARGACLTRDAWDGDSAPLLAELADLFNLIFP